MPCLREVKDSQDPSVGSCSGREAKKFGALAFIWHNVCIGGHLGKRSGEGTAGVRKSSGRNPQGLQAQE